MTPRLSTLLCVPFLALAALACATPQAPSPGPLVSLEGQRVLVTPFNLGIRRAPELDQKAGLVAYELVEALQERGAEVQVIEPKAAIELWEEAAADRASGFQAAAGRFARLAADEGDFDLVLLPSLVIRGAEVEGSFARWDGVDRELSVEVPVHDPAFDVAGVGIDGLDGLVLGASLHLVALRPAGDLAFQGIAGLDLMQQATRLEGEGAEQWQLKAREEPLRDLEHIRQGVELAFERKPQDTAAWAR